MKTVLPRRLQQHTLLGHIRNQHLYNSYVRRMRRRKLVFLLLAIEYFIRVYHVLTARLFYQNTANYINFALFSSIRLLGQKVEQLFVLHVLQGVHVDSQRLRHTAHVQAERLQQLDKIEFFP